MRGGRGGGKRWAGLAAVVICAGATGPVHAQEVDLTWRAPSTCPSGDQVKTAFQRSVRVRQGRVPPRLAATAVVQENGGRWFLHLHTQRDGLEGDRDLEADSCASLARAAALVLTLVLGEGDALEDAAASGGAGASSTPTSDVPQTGAAGPISPVAPAPEKEQRAPRRHATLAWSIAADMHGGWGPLPGPSFGGGGGIDLRAKGRWGLRGRVESWPGVRQGPAPGLQTSFDGIGGSASVCVLGAPLRFLLLSACAGVEAIAVRGSSAGGTRQGVAVAPWYAALSSLGARLPLVDAVHVDLAFELAASLTRPRFAVDGLGEVYAVREFAPSASLGLSFDL